MIAMLTRPDGETVAELEDEGEWTGSPSYAAIVEVLNLMFDPRQETFNRTGDHHAGWGCEQARQAGNQFGCKVAYPPKEPLPPGAVS